jgi:Flp pilus assembly protein TadG
MHPFTRARGQSLVELVLFVPILLAMILSMVDFSLAYANHVRIRNAVAEGGYYAAQNPGDLNGVRGQILHELRDLNPAITAADITITPCIAGTSGPETAILVQYDHELIFGPNVTLNNSTTVPQFGGCR